ncbi:MAG: ribulose-phosphate 3-epimerase [Candidatus Eisenbacteria bacterium]|nr:ribulose-phosphate 3-epimerase [Candidatus Eisenbacteria bacterium]MCC7142408.1 ribulose-phosphate 3-epimerase [Candidatus Eisenbacteria bacterium]
MNARDRLAALRGPHRVLPSILSADFAALAASFLPLEEAGCEVLHLDVMDGHFVPNITFGPPLVKSIRARSHAFLDTHLMIDDPLRYLEPFARAGSDLCTVHCELPLDPAALAAEAARVDTCLGVAIRPSTSLDAAVERWAPFVDLILVMSVEPGFGGQKFMPAAVERLQRAAEISARHGVAPILEVDGGIDANTAPLVRAGGASWLVAGSAVFGNPSPVDAWRQLSRD